MVKMCCEDMKEKSYCVDKESNTTENVTDDKMIYYSSKFNEYGLPVYDGENGKASSYVLIQYCPWCGKKLPDSRREEWFDCLERLGFDNPFENYNELPHMYKTSEWWQRQG